MLLHLGQNVITFSSLLHNKGRGPSTAPQWNHTSEYGLTVGSFLIPTEKNIADNSESNERAAELKIFAMSSLDAMLSE